GVLPAEGAGESTEWRARRHDRGRGRRSRRPTRWWHALDTPVSGPTRNDLGGPLARAREESRGCGLLGHRSRSWPAGDVRARGGRSEVGKDGAGPTRSRGGAEDVGPARPAHLPAAPSTYEQRGVAAHRAARGDAGGERPPEGGDGGAGGVRAAEGHGV